MKNFGKILYILTMSLALTGIVIGIANDFWIERPRVEQVEKKPRINPADKYCMETALFYEIRNGTKEAIRNVADVILNRVEAKGFPGDICGVVFQHKQFSAFNQGKPSLDWQDSVESHQDKIALATIKEVTEESLTQGATNTEILWYHTGKVKPSWSKKLKLAFHDGYHRFFKKEG